MFRDRFRIPFWAVVTSVIAIIFSTLSAILFFGVIETREQIRRGLRSHQSLGMLSDETFDLFITAAASVENSRITPQIKSNLESMRNELASARSFAMDLPELAPLFVELSSTLDHLNEIEREPDEQDQINRQRTAQFSRDLRTWQNQNRSLRKLIRDQLEPIAEHAKTLLIVLMVMLSVVLSALISCAVVILRDSKKRTVIEEQLHASEEKYQNIYKHGPLAFVLWNPQGEVLEWNLKTEEILGWTSEDLRGLKLFDLVPDESHGSTQRALLGLLEDKAPLRKISQLNTRDQSQLLCECHSSVLHDSMGKVSSVITTFLDVTEREKAEARLRQSEARYKRLFDSNMIAIALTKKDGRFVDVNQMFLDLSGYSREELDSGQITSAQLIPEEYLERDRRAFRQLLEHGTCERYEKELIRKDGSRIPIEFGAYEFDPKSTNYYVCYFLDLTLRRNAEKQARESTELIESIRNAQLDFIAATDIRRVFDTLLDALLRLTHSGYGFIGEVRQTSENESMLVALSITDQGENLESRSAFNEQLKAGIGLQQLDELLGFSVIEQDSNRIEWNCKPLRRGSGNNRQAMPDIDQFLGLPFFHGNTLVGVIGIANSREAYNETDIAHLQPLLTTCASLIAADRVERSRLQTETELQASKAAAEAANQAKDRFLAVLSHELRTPLTPVLAVVTSARDEPGATPEMREICEMVRRNIELESRLIDDLLDVSKISRGIIKFDKLIVDVHSLIRQAASICQTEIVANELTLVFSLDAQHHRVEIDPARLQQVLWNLIKNAVKFTPPGGTITITTSNELFESSPETTLCIQVQDTGVGIETFDLPRIFQAFEQGESSIRRRSAGLGLGLAICKSVIEGHGGTLEAQSLGRDHGSCFIIKLVATNGSIDEPNVAPPPDKTSLSSRIYSILLVEDNKDTLHYLTLLLRQSGHRIHSATNLADATTLIDTVEFDLLLSDIELPDGTGLELVRHLRSSKQSTIPAVAMSGFGSIEDLSMSLEAGFQVHLTKPVDFKRLSTTIEHAMSINRDSIKTLSEEK